MAARLARSHVLRAVAVPGGAALLAACGAGPPGSEQPAGASRRAGKFTAYFVANDPTEGPRFFNETVLPRFEQQVPGIKVEPVMDVFGPLMEKLAVTMAAGSGPDLWHTDDLNGPGYAVQGWVKDRSDLVKRDAKALAPVAGLLDTYRDPEGRLFGPPLLLVCAALVFNRAIFDRLGVKYPDDTLEWNPRDGGTFLELARKLTRPADELYGWWWSGQSTADTLSWLKQHNGAWLDRTRTRADLLRPESLQAFEWMGDLVNRHNVSPKPKDAPLQDNERGGRHWLFLRGKAAMFSLLLGQESAWSRETLDQSAGLLRVGVVPLPKGLRRAAGSTSHLWYLRGDTPDPELPWEFVKWWYNDLDTQVGCWTTWRYGLPASRKAWSDPRLLQPRADRPLDARPFIEPWEKGYAVGHEANPVWAGADGWFNAFNRPFTAALNGEQPMKLAIEQAQREVQAVLDQRLPRR
jgi:multiple sugar transport system substrate-binding protein